MMLPTPLANTSVIMPRLEQRYPAMYPPTVIPANMQSFITPSPWTRPVKKTISNEAPGSAGVKLKGCVPLRGYATNPTAPMNDTRDFTGASRLLRAGILLLSVAWAPAAFAGSGTGEITSISSVAAAGYVREKRADGSWKPETFAFGQGGHVVGRSAAGAIDKMGFDDLVKVIAVPLAARNYRQADDPADANLLIMIYWGTTSGTEGASGSAEYQNLQANQKAPAPPPMHPDPATARGGNGAADPQIAQMNQINSRLSEANFDSALQMVTAEDSERRLADMRNAQVLGYDSEFAVSPALQNTVLGGRIDQMMKEVEEDRYFVVMMAYDFQKLWKDKKRKLLWVTRISIRQRGNDFAKILPAMMQDASDYFGRDSHGLQRREIQEGHVEVGEPVSIGVLPSK
jgi:hypothetical protein